MDRPAEQNVPSTLEIGDLEADGEAYTTSSSTPRRTFGVRDHLCAFVTFVAALASGLLALSGHPWWAALSAMTAIIVASTWVSARQRRAHEPPLGATTLVSAVFGAWLVLPIYRGIRHGETAPFPELLILGGLAPAAWLMFYAWLLIRR